MGDDRFDPLFMQVASQAGGIIQLLDCFFGFMKRKTDFYYVQKSKEEKMGFPEGAAEKLVLHAFRKHLEATRGPAREDMEREAERRDKEKKATAKATPAAPKAAKKEEPKAKTKVGGVSIEELPDETKETKAAAPTQGPVKEKGGSTKPTLSEPRQVSGGDDEGHPKSSFSTYNGATTDKYRWSQTLNDLTIEVPVPVGTKGKQLDVEISAKGLKVGIKGHAPILDGNYPKGEGVHQDDCFWSVESSTGFLTITLDKTRETWWKHPIEGEPEIDTTKVDSTRNVDDYDNETQGAIRKIMFDQEQKRKGLPTSEEIEKQEMLKKAWDAEGSPFKGQPFDPSVLQGAMGGDGQLPPGFPPMPPGGPQ